MAENDVVGIRYSELPKTLDPTYDDLVAVLDNESNILKATRLKEAVNCTLGGHDISDIADGTVTGALVELDERRVVGALEVPYDEYLENKAYYDAMDNFIIINDHYVIVMRADQVSYDNTTSGLSATTAQAAIDESYSKLSTSISTNVTTINNTMIPKAKLVFQLQGSDLYITKTY